MIVQVAGIRTVDEARMVLDAGADLLGFPLRLDHHAPDVREAEAAAIIAEAECAAHAVCITYETDPRELCELVARLGVRGLQLHGRMDVAQVAAVRRALGEGVWLARSVVVGRDVVDADAVRAVLPYVDALLTDTYDSNTGASGATGRTHD